MGTKLGVLFIFSFCLTACQLLEYKIFTVKSFISNYLILMLKKRLNQFLHQTLTTFIILRYKPIKSISKPLITHDIQTPRTLFLHCLTAFLIYALMFQVKYFPKPYMPSIRGFHPHMSGFTTK